MKLLVPAVMASLCMLGLSACVSGPAFDSIADRIPPLPEHQGRIYFYRVDSIVGAATQPDIQLNGEVVGESLPGGFCFVDRPPGDYEVVCKAEATHKLSLRLEEGQTRYVKTTISAGFMGGHVTPSLVDPAEGEKALHLLKYTGPELPARKPST